LLLDGEVGVDSVNLTKVLEAAGVSVDSMLAKVYAGALSKL